MLSAVWEGEWVVGSSVCKGGRLGVEREDVLSWIYGLRSGCIGCTERVTWGEPGERYERSRGSVWDVFLRRRRRG